MHMEVHFFWSGPGFGIIWWFNGMVLSEWVEIGVGFDRVFYAVVEMDVGHGEVKLGGLWQR